MEGPGAVSRVAGNGRGYICKHPLPGGAGALWSLSWCHHVGKHMRCPCLDNSVPSPSRIPCRGPHYRELLNKGLQAWARLVHRPPMVLRCVWAFVTVKNPQRFAYELSECLSGRLLWHSAQQRERSFNSILRQNMEPLVPPAGQPPS